MQLSLCLILELIVDLEGADMTNPLEYIKSWGIWSVIPISPEVFLIIHIILCITVGIKARRNGRSFILYLIISDLITPILAFIIVTILGERSVPSNTGTYLYRSPGYDEWERERRDREEESDGLEYDFCNHNRFDRKICSYVYDDGWIE